MPSESHDHSARPSGRPLGRTPYRPLSAAGALPSSSLAAKGASAMKTPRSLVRPSIMHKDEPTACQLQRLRGPPSTPRPFHLPSAAPPPPFQISATAASSVPRPQILGNQTSEQVSENPWNHVQQGSVVHGPLLSSNHMGMPLRMMPPPVRARRAPARSLGYSFALMGMHARSQADTHIRIPQGTAMLPLIRHFGCPTHPTYLLAPHF